MHVDVPLNPKNKQTNKQNLQVDKVDIIIFWSKNSSFAQPCMVSEIVDYVWKSTIAEFFHIFDNPAKVCRQDDILGHWINWNLPISKCNQLTCKLSCTFVTKKLYSHVGAERN